MLGHVDTGKTSLLDKIRGSAVQLREAGGLTQQIGASFFPLDTLVAITKQLIRDFKADVKIPGLLVIDTPGHEAFANLRRRGGSVADIAILVIDVMHGFENQTYESIEILKARKTPFIIAANKIDRIDGWKSVPETPFLASYGKQVQLVKEDLDNRVYIIMGVLSRLGFRSERFDKVRNFTRDIAIVPVSAKTGEGIGELLAVLIGLTQQYMTEKLQVTEGPALGTVLEVKEEVGLGTTINAIIYDGVLRRDEAIVIGGKEGPIVTNIRSILLPQPLDEIRDPRKRFNSIDEVPAAAGVKIAAPNLEDAIPGAPLIAVGGDMTVERAKNEVSSELQRLRIYTDKVGVVLKTDTLGSLEALTESLSARHPHTPCRHRRHIQAGGYGGRLGQIRGAPLRGGPRIQRQAFARRGAGGAQPAGPYLQKRHHLQPHGRVYQVDGGREGDQGQEGVRRSGEAGEDRGDGGLHLQKGEARHIRRLGHEREYIL
jgi:translation initiation factor 5B